MHLRTWPSWRGDVIRCTRLRCTRLQDRTCETSGGLSALHGLGAHGCSSELLRLAWGTSQRSWFQETRLLPMRILIFSKKSPFRKFKLNFFPLKNFVFFFEINNLMKLWTYDWSFKKFAWYVFSRNTPYFVTSSQIFFWYMEVFHRFY